MPLKKTMLVTSNTEHFNGARGRGAIFTERARSPIMPTGAAHFALGRAFRDHLGVKMNRACDGCPEPLITHLEVAVY